MANTYAQIQNSSVVNMIMAYPEDYFDTNYVWVNLTNLYCVDGTPIQIGCTYDGTNFYPPVEND